MRLRSVAVLRMLAISRVSTMKLLFPIPRSS